MDPRDEMEPAELEPLTSAFRNQLLACLEECARGRRGLFAEVSLTAEETGAQEWPEAARLRELAAALQAVLSQAGERFALADEFLDLCTIHGEHDPGEARLAREFLKRIERGEVGTPTEEEWKPW